MRGEKQPPGVTVGPPPVSKAASSFYFHALSATMMLYWVCNRGYGMSAWGEGVVVTGVGLVCRCAAGKCNVRCCGPNAKFGHQG